MRSLTCGDGKLDMVPCILPGTTPTLAFALDFDTSSIDLDKTHIIFVCDKIKIDKNGANLTLGDNYIKTMLLEEETNSFDNPQLNMQIVITFNNGKIAKSNIMYARVGKVL